MTNREYRFELSHGQDPIIIEAGTQPEAIEKLRESVDHVKSETVIGLDVDVPKFWIKRGKTLFPISVKAAAVCMH
jgi:hypothetical protein